MFIETENAIADYFRKNNIGYNEEIRWIMVRELVKIIEEKEEV